MKRPSPRPRLPSAERRIRYGNYEARKRGDDRGDLDDPYRLIVALGWPRFILALLGVELLLNLIFALLYIARPGAVANAHPGSLADAFFFSIETLATVGYGEMYPADLYGHIVSAVEIVTGVAFVAVVTGMIFVRVSRPKPCFRYAETLVITRYRGRPTLMIRVASSRLGVLYDAEARLSALVPEETDQGRSFPNIVDLPLVRAGIPVFALSWTLMHVIDEASPLAGLDQPAMAAAGLQFFLTMRAEDTTLSATVRDLHAFSPAQLHIGMHYADAISISDDGHPIVDLDRLGVLEPDASPIGEDALSEIHTANAGRAATARRSSSTSSTTEPKE